VEIAKSDGVFAILDGKDPGTIWLLSTDMLGVICNIQNISKSIPISNPYKI
jgi:hypothetical protein